MKKILTFIIILFINYSIVLANSGNIEQGKMKSLECSACHMADGNSVVSIWPKIAGQHFEYIYQQLKYFQAGEKGPRYNPIMLNIVGKLSDEDLLDLSAYFSSNKMSSGKALSEHIVLGRKIYHGGNMENNIPACAACHDVRGQGNSVGKIPRLSGQHADYTVDQLNKYKSGERTSGPNQIMTTIAAKMSPEEIKAVSSYIEGLH
jgi:cytochrome c553